MPRANRLPSRSLLTNGQDEMISAANIYIEALKRLGIEARLTTVDNAQYKERTNAYAFDMTHFIRSLSLSPGNEQVLYWGAAGVTEPGTRNWPGINSPCRGRADRRDAAGARPCRFHRRDRGAGPGADHRALRRAGLVL